MLKASSLTFIFFFCFDVSFHKAKGAICFCGNCVYVEVPGKATRYINPQVSCTGDNFKDLTV